jgi:hypothetical protein
MEAIYRAAAYTLCSDPNRAVILDGRTFLRLYQTRDLMELAHSMNRQPFIIECVCDDETARTRLERDRAEATHVAGNRTFELYLELKRTAEPIFLPHLVLDTGRLDVEECVRRSLEYIRGG